MSQWLSVLFMGASAPSEVPSPDSILERIFGVDVTQFASLLTGGEETLLGGVATVTSTAAVFFTAALIVYTFLTQIITAATAKEGQGITMSGWWAVRWAIALGLMIPTPSGYNVFQALVLYGAGQGSNIATAAWDRTQDKFIDNSSIQAQTGVSAAKFGGGAQTVNDLYRLALCEAVADKGNAEQAGFFTTSLAVAPITTDGQYTSGMVSTAANFFGASLMTTKYNMISMNGEGALRAGVCGSVSWDTIVAAPGSDGIEKSVRGTIGARVDNALTQLRTIAKQEVSGGWTEAVRAGAVRKVVEWYGKDAQISAMNVLLSSGGSPQQIMLTKFRRDTEDAGWLAAGAFMWSYNASIARTLAVGNTALDVVVTVPDSSAMPEFMAKEYDSWQKRVDMTAARQFTAKGVRENTTADNAKFEVEVPTHVSLGMVAGLLKYFEKKVTDFLMGAIKYGTLGNAEEGNDPLIGIQTIGNNLITAGNTAFVGAGLLKTFDIAESARLFLSWTGFYFLVIGAFLALYLPALPFILWIGGLISWFLMVIEAVLVAPLWLAAHAMPEGDGFAGQHAKQGYTMMIGLIARPILMVGGLIAALLLARVMLSLTGVLFVWFIDLMWSETALDPISAAGIFAIYAFLVVYVTRQCFALIHLVPDRALRYIGASDQHGEGVREGNIHSGVMASFALLQGLGGGKGNGKGADKSKNSISESP